MAKKYRFRTTFTYNGKRHEVYADTQKDLKLKLARKMNTLLEQQPILAGSMTVRAWTERAIETYKTNQKEITREKFVRRVNHCILEDLGSMRLEDVKPLHCQNILNKQAGNSVTQINEVYNALRFIFRTAVENDLIRRSPAEGLTKPAGTKTNRRSLTDRERELVRIVAKKKPKYVLFLLMLDCGLRPEEAASVMGQDIIVRDEIPLLHVRGSKTANADRIVPIPAELYERIKDTPANSYIAVYENGRQITASNRNRVWQAFRRDMNIEMGAAMYRNQLQEDLVSDDLVPYCLRHDYCSRLARAKVDIRTAQKLMGHSSIALTANIYTHIDQTDILDAAKLIDNAEGPTPGPTLKTQNNP